MKLNATILYLLFFVHIPDKVQQPDMD